VWLDRSGRVRLPPLTAGMARDRVIVTTGLALAGLAGLLTFAGVVWGCVLSRRRLSAWARAWRQVEPLWSSLE
jgi:hypothetical protein